ncbi:hypothetical protein PanWU01x14_193660 [Parasponia andersonii]|uniref:F-box domain containing protein n=1 Tax=Parasponia andersonii TaxID=3476 RepID=A0A2P5C0V1_PARAD|nr:hypothetical protein PanWU01x14_193660 [Parasponia andersonii]
MSMLEKRAAAMEYPLLNEDMIMSILARLPVKSLSCDSSAYANHATKEFKILKEQEEPLKISSSYGFGFDPKANDYK